ncbi:response regulator transcription factor [Alkalibacterium pelagium]|uniref:Two-component system, OmpR family, response regulator ResD n=1 Tax=Alkalibacterium pelagium TaxID=426702 RepID=A0A1H7GIP7_9LACT|nr:response regulator transcription factor [Alkalibacterium pelagium]GEN49843.1 DNA-binding response regulator [Alkalibacterium pelagium]SEK35705.1 two-component system, OmpR family, response regulator ResD [Alkalibacterium pelagium]
MTEETSQGNAKKLLVVDDEDRIRRLLKMYLEKADYDIDEAENGRIALDLALENEYDLILLDVMMPEMDGIQVAEEIRKEKETPIMMLTAKGEELNRIQGFEVGADDYIVKPFSPREIVLRVAAIIKRTRSSAGGTDAAGDVSDTLKLPHLEIDNDSRRVTADGKSVNLTPKEYDLLHYLMSAPDQIFGREQLLREVWKYEFFGDLRTVDTHVKRLREKLKKESDVAAKMIETVWGLGYKLNSYPHEEEE